MFNPFIGFLARRGLSVWGSRVLEVPVNLLAFDRAEYLVSPRGHGQRVRNVRANDGRLDLLLGRTRRAYVATEVADADKVDVLRAYLTRWKFEVGQFFEGVGPDSSDDELAAIAPDHPVFRLDAATAVLDADGARSTGPRRPRAPARTSGLGPKRPHRRQPLLGTHPGCARRTTTTRVQDPARDRHSPRYPSR